jgi:arylsulfatase A-like enzyme
MRRREFFGKATAAVAGAGALSYLLKGCGTKTGEKWNIVFILSDDLGWNQVGYHGFDFYETPNIDRIAGEGMFFTDAYSAAPVCSPTRASIMTGKYPARLHLTDYIPGSPFPYAKVTREPQAPCLPLEEVTLPEKLKEHGYVTGHFGKWHLSTDKKYQPGRKFDPGSQGFDEVFTTVKPVPEADPDADAHHSIEITRRSVDFIKSNADKPFFCYVSYHCVHRPIMENAELIEKYEAKPESELPEFNPIMGAMVERMDRGIGEILETLDELELSTNTIVVFVSDNGGLESLQSQRPLRHGKATIYEGGMKVPMAIRWPGAVKPGTMNSVPVISNDFFPTLLEALGIEYDTAAIDGESLVPLLKGGTGLKRDAIYFHYPHYHHQGLKPASAIREGDYKLIEWYEQSVYGDEEGQINLYNVREDVGESVDLAEKKPELAARLREKLHRWRKAVGAQEMVRNPNYDPARADWRFMDSEE